MTSSRVEDINRVGNISLRKLHDHLEIVKWDVNRMYGKQNQYDAPNAHGLCKSITDPYIKVHKDCFVHPEFCYTLASWDLTEEEPDLRYCGRRPLDLMLDEYDVFEQLVREGYEYIERNKEN